MSFSPYFSLIFCIAGQVVPAEGQTPAARRILAPELVAQALADRPEPPLSGQPWTLARALSAAFDRPGQQAISQAYWRLTEAVAKYNFAREEVRKLEGLSPRPGEEAALRAAQSAAAARRRKAELAVTEAQYTLAALVRLPPQSALPWPADPPHVGGYQTYFAELSAQGRLPERTRLIDRLLPLERSAVDGRADSVLAATDALAAVEEDYQAGRADLGAVTAAVEKRHRQQAAFIEAACRYNDEIAEYACAAMAPNLPATQLAAAMIPSGALQPTPAALPDSAVQPAGHLEPTPAAENPPDRERPPIEILKAGPLVPVEPRPDAVGEVPPARSAGSETLPATQEKAPFSPPGNWGGSPSPEAKGTAPFSPPVQGDSPIFPSEKSGQSPRENQDRLQATPQGDPFAPRKREPTPAKRPRPAMDAPFEKAPAEEPPKSDAQSSERDPPADIPELRTSTASPQLVRKESAEPSTALHWSGGEAEASVNTLANDPRPNPLRAPRSGRGEGTTDPALYTALQRDDAAMQTKQLTLALHADRGLSECRGQPMTLEECLSRLPGGDRKAALAAYWTTRQRAAEYQVLAEQRDLLDLLTPQALAHRQAPSGATEMLQLRAAQLNAQADLLESQVRLIEAQFNLGRQTQATAAAEWPMPTTVPHFGSYETKFDQQSRQIADSWPMRRLEGSLPQFHRCLQQQAAAVIAADAARAQAAGEFDTGRVAVALVLDRIAAQTRRTMEFLQTQTDYNEAIAAYAVTVLPSETPPARLVASLVVKP
ncbi:MAG: hypothetical protein JXB10_03230 [Pirellulales bacterium]|nr:hypothetical protein [Pirellulales bacterium]